MKEVNGATWIALPTFHFVNERAQTMRDLIQAIETDRDKLRDGRNVVIDVRGNEGGNSGWGNQLATALFGENLVKPITDSFDWTVDWRASEGNIVSALEDARRGEKTGESDNVSERRTLAAQMREALNNRQPYLRKTNQVSPMLANMGSSPFRGRVFLLTDGRCASACLDFLWTFWYDCRASFTLVSLQAATLSISTITESL
jgi:hypothetical protein